MIYRRCITFCVKARKAEAAQLTRHCASAMSRNIRPRLAETVTAPPELPYGSDWPIGRAPYRARMSTKLSWTQTSPQSQKPRRDRPSLKQFAKGSTSAREKEGVACPNADPQTTMRPFRTQGALRPRMHGGPPFETDERSSLPDEDCGVNLSRRRVARRGANYGAPTRCRSKAVGCHDRQIQPDAPNGLMAGPTASGQGRNELTRKWPRGLGA